MTMPSPDIATNLQRIQNAIAEAAAAANRAAHDVQLIAVSKTNPADAVRFAYEAGQRHFGENRVQELSDKAPVLPGDIHWHMIGHLQRNKVKEVVGTAALIHSVDSLRLLRRIDQLAAELGHQQPILLQANVSAEESKYGFSLEGLKPVVEEARGMPHIELRGFMTMAPFEADSAELRQIFGRLRAFRDQQEKALDCKLPELSMGMSGDYREAIAEGATMVRVGTAIFGARK